MKLCPHCDFIYEDDQSFCDMDGKELVLNPGSGPARFRLTIPIGSKSPKLATPPEMPNSPEVLSATTGRSSGFLVAALVVFVLVTLVVVVYVARSRQTGAQRSTQSPHSSLSATDQPGQAQSTNQQPATPEATSEQTSAARPTDESAASSSESVVSASAKTPLAHSRVNAGPVSASAAANRGSVIIRLTNGAAIKADDAWEKREGVWYRQAGMVTFLERRRVRSIERIAPATASPAKVTAGASGSSSQVSKTARTREQSSVVKVEPANTKKDSRVTSFLKKTGNLIKKPFRF